MHILVTGGTGFIGSHLCRNLIRAGHEITVYSRKPDKVPQIVHPNARGIGQLSPTLLSTPPEAMINLAGAPIANRRWSDKRKQELVDSRVQTTHQLVQLIGQLPHPPNVLVSGSAVGYYGAQGDTAVTETTKPHDEFTHQLCHAWEEAAERATGFGTRVAISRTGLVLGKQGFLKRMLPAFKLCLGGPLGDGEQFMPWIHIDDLVRILKLLLENPQCKGPYNATAPQPVSNEEFSKCLGDVLHRPAKLKAPAVALKLLLGEMSQLLLTGQKAIPKRLLDEHNFSFRFRTLEAALQDVLV